MYKNLDIDFILQSNSFFDIVLNYYWQISLAIIPTAENQSSQTLIFMFLSEPLWEFSSYWFSVIFKIQVYSDNHNFGVFVSQGVWEHIWNLFILVRFGD